MQCMENHQAYNWVTILYAHMKVHESQIIGELGKGYKYAIEVLNIGRIGIGAQVKTILFQAFLGNWNCMDN